MKKKQEKNAKARAARAAKKAEKESAAQEKAATEKAEQEKSVTDVELQYKNAKRAFKKAKEDGDAKQLEETKRTVHALKLQLEAMKGATGSKSAAEAAPAQAPEQKKAPAAKKAEAKAAEADSWEVKKILDHRGGEGAEEYLVHWGKPWDDSWEPKPNLHCSDLIRAYHKAQRKAAKEAELRARWLAKQSDSEAKRESRFREAANLIQKVKGVGEGHVETPRTASPFKNLNSPRKAASQSTPTRPLNLERLQNASHDSPALDAKAALGHKRKGSPDAATSSSAKKKTAALPEGWRRIVHKKTGAVAYLRLADKKRFSSPPTAANH